MYIWMEVKMENAKEKVEEGEEEEEEEEEERESVMSVDATDGWMTGDEHLWIRVGGEVRGMRRGRMEKEEDGEGG